MNNQIFEIISECNYPMNSRDYIGMVILELYNLDNATAFYKVMRNNEKVIVAHFKVKVLFKSKSYDVPILIYIPKTFPKTAPEIYIENQSDIGVNPKNKDIDVSTKKLSLGTLRGWNVYSTISGVIEDIKVSFNKEFPIYKKNNTNTSVVSNNSGNNTTNISNSNINNSIYNSSYGNNNINNSTYNNNINTSNTSTIKSNSMYSNYYNNNNNSNFNNYNNNNNNINNINTSTFNNNNNLNTSTFNNNNNNFNNNLNNLKPNFNNMNLNNTTNLNSVHYESEIKKKLVEELKKQLEPKLKEEVICLKKQEDILLNYKKEFSSMGDSLSNLSGNKNKAINLLNDYIISINDDVNNLKDYIQKLNESNLNNDNYESFIEYTNKDLIKVCCIEATLEDLVSVLKKAFDKGVFSYEESLKLIRETTKEIIKVRCYKENLVKLYSRK